MTEPTGLAAVPLWAWLVAGALLVALAFAVIAIRGYPKDGAF